MGGGNYNLEGGNTSTGVGIREADKEERRLFFKDITMRIDDGINRHLGKEAAMEGDIDKGLWKESS